MAQALVQHLAALRIRGRARSTAAPPCSPTVRGVFAIFGHGNVAGLGEALYARAAARLPTYRAHNEQGYGARRDCAYSKAQFRQRIMAVTT